MLHSNSTKKTGWVIYEYRDYRKYLRLRLKTSGETRGLRSKIAAALKTKPSFVTQVIAGKNSLSPEHCPVVNAMLGHSGDEGHYFTLLVLWARAGSKALEEYYRIQVEELLVRRQNYLERIKATETLAKQDQAIYYSKWYYSVIHLLCSIPELQSKSAIAKRINLSPALVSQAVEQLMGMGLIQMKDSKLTISNKQVLLKKDSPWIAQMHTNYRLRAIDRMSEIEKNDFHYSLGVGLFRKDFDFIREKILQWLEELHPMMGASKEEEACCLLIDFFKLV